MACNGSILCCTKDFVRYKNFKFNSITLDHIECVDYFLSLIFQITWWIVTFIVIHIKTTKCAVFSNNTTLSQNALFFLQCMCFLHSLQPCPLARIGSADLQRGSSFQHLFLRVVPQGAARLVNLPEQHHQRDNSGAGNEAHRARPVHGAAVEWDGLSQLQQVSNLTSFNFIYQISECLVLSWFKCRILATLES